MTETWLPVVDYEGYYEVSDQGTVRSIPRMVTYRDGRVGLFKGQVLAQQPHPLLGHLSVGLSREGKMSTRKVHQLVLEAFWGPCPDGMECCHWDGNPSNNALSNLRWDTPSANVLDQVRIGTHVQARKTHCRQGHEYTPENTRVCKGKRYCIPCDRARWVSGGSGSVARKQARAVRAQRLNAALS